MKLFVTVTFAALTGSVAGRALDGRIAGVNFSSDLGSELKATVNLTNDLFSPAPVFHPNPPGPPALGFNKDDLASPSEWSHYTQKGGQLICALLATDREAGQMSPSLNAGRNPPSVASEFKGTLEQDFRLWYWYPTRNEGRARLLAEKQCDLDDHGEMREVMRGLGLNGKPVAKGGDNACFRMEHWDSEVWRGVKDQWYWVGDRKYRATGAYYEFGINTNGGAIFNFDVLSPASSAKKKWPTEALPPNPNHLPKLRALSDVLWGFWKRNNPDVRNIKYFFMMDITNRVTNRLIAKALKDRGEVLGRWPGARFEADGEEGHALLGSPNGAVFAYFLLQRKEELGIKIITHITAVRNESPDPNEWVGVTLIFHVGDSNGREL